MKKYETPVLEIFEMEHINHLLDESQDPYADAKQNHIIFIEEEIVEEEDTTSIWDDPWKIKYSLWDEE